MELLEGRTLKNRLDAERLRQREIAVLEHQLKDAPEDNAARTCGVMGKRPEAIGMLKRAKTAGYQNLEWTRRDPDLACLHGEPEFEKLFDPSAKA